MINSKSSTSSERKKIFHRRGFRTITVDGTIYQWRIGGGSPGRPGHPGYPLLGFIVKKIGGTGGTLYVEFSGILAPNCPCPTCNASAGVALPSHVARAIREALVKGWKPEEPGKTFRLVVSHEEYNVPHPI